MLYASLQERRHWLFFFVCHLCFLSPRVAFLPLKRHRKENFYTLINSKRMFFSTFSILYGKVLYFRCCFFYFLVCPWTPSVAAERKWRRPRVASTCEGRQMSHLTNVWIAGKCRSCKTSHVHPGTSYAHWSSESHILKLLGLPTHLLG